MSQMSTTSAHSDRDSLEPADIILHATPPSPTDDNELRLNKKREREISVEPSSVKSNNNQVEQDANRPPPHDLPVPTKKNKIEPSSPTDSNDSAPTTPPKRSPKLTDMLTPQHESKVKQIRKRVEDMTWQDPNSKDGSFIVEDPPSPGEISGRNNTQVVVEPEAAFLAEAKADISNPNGTSSGDRFEGAGLLPDQIPSKRKLQDRTVSSVARSEPCVNGESAKRPRDDGDEDSNPRETKRPSPPPMKEPAPAAQPKPAPTAPPTLPASGFLSFASAISPFGQAKAGPSSWTTTTSSSSVTTKPAIASSKEASKNSKTSAFASTPPPVEPKKGNAEPSQPGDKPKPLFGVTSAPGAGFTGFSGMKTAFGTSSLQQSKQPRAAFPSSGPKRSKSPTHGNAFTPYNSSIRGFAIPKATRRKRSTSPGGSTGSPERSGPSSWSDNDNADSALSFSAQLQKEDKAGPGAEDSNHKVDLQEQESFTGEEDETTVFSVRAKLYVLSDQKQWKERGTGPLKINARKDDESNIRLLMRKEGVHSLVLNVPLFREMKLEVAQDPRYVRFAVPSKGMIEHYNLRLSSAKAVEDLVDAVQQHLPQ